MMDNEARHFMLKSKDESSENAWNGNARACMRTDVNSTTILWYNIAYVQFEFVMYGTVGI